MSIKKIIIKNKIKEWCANTQMPEAPADANTSDSI